MDIHVLLIATVGILGGWICFPFIRSVYKKMRGKKVEIPLEKENKNEILTKEEGKRFIHVELISKSEGLCSIQLTGPLVLDGEVINIAGEEITVFYSTNENSSNTV